MMMAVMAKTQSIIS